MATIACPDCSREISEKAPACPGCGRPMGIAPPRATVTRRAGGSYEAVGTLLILGGIVGCAAGAVAPSMLAVGVGFVVFLVGRFK